MEEEEKEEKSVGRLTQDETMETGKVTHDQKPNTQAIILPDVAASLSQVLPLPPTNVTVWIFG